MNFKDYKKNKNDKNEAKEAPFNLDEGAAKLLSGFLKDYEGKSYNEILTEVISVATKKRSEGTLSDAELEGFRAMLKPMLSYSQQQELDKIIDKLKQI